MTMNIEQLAHRCAEETDKYRRRLPNDTQYCFELLRRALAEEDQEAISRVEQIYQSQVRSWVSNHSQFAATGETVEYFASRAFSKLYFALRGERFARFAGLPQIMQFLKKCVHTGIMDHMRRELPEDPLDESNVPSADGPSDFGALWAYICGLLPDECERILIECRFLLGLRPAQIVQDFPDCWQDARDVSVALQRVRRRLSSDPGLRDWVSLV